MGKGIDIKIVEAKPWPPSIFTRLWHWLIFLITSLIALFGFKEKNKERK